MLGDDAIAYMAVSPAFPKKDREAALSLAQSIGARVVLVATEELAIPEYAANAVDRCYHCKRHILGRIGEAARSRGLRYLVDGINADDAATHGHGMRAARELGVRSPLAEVGLRKEEIRNLSRRMGLPSADRPHSACLASRIPYGQGIDEKKLGQVERAEEVLRQEGVGQLRVRHHGEIARIEVLPEDLQKVLASRERIARQLKAIGFRYVCLDLEGFRSGSLEPESQKG